MEHLEGILRLAEQELGSIVQNGKFRSREEIHSVYELMDIAKDAFCIWKYEEEDSDYSEGYDDNRSMTYGKSYARGRNVKRDSTGRYSRDDGMRYREGRSYRGGYSRGGKEEYIEHLREMMEDAPDEQTRQNIKRMIDSMEQH